MLGGTPTGGRGQDRWCVEGGGSLRVGYATGSLAKAGAARRSLRGRAVLILTSSKSARDDAPATPGKRAKKPRGATSVRKGSETWFFVKGRRGTNVVRTRARKVVEVGVAEPRLARGAAARKLVRLG